MSLGPPRRLPIPGHQRCREPALKGAFVTQSLPETPSICQPLFTDLPDCLPAHHRRQSKESV